MKTRHHRHNSSHGSQPNGTSLKWMNDEIWIRMTVAVCDLGFDIFNTEIDANPTGKETERDESE